jgi:hypothetical protein
MSKRFLVAAAVLSAAAPLCAQTTKAVGIAIVDNGYADRSVVEQTYCSSPGCLAGRFFYWSCSGSSCTPVTPTSYSAHAGEVARAAARVARDHENGTDPALVVYSIVGDPEPYLAANPTRIKVVVNTLGTGSMPPSCGAGAPPADLTVVRASGNQGLNGFLRLPSPPLFRQGQIDCRPGVTSVAGTIAHPSLSPGLGVWVYDRSGVACYDLSNDNDPCSEYPFVVQSNFSPQTAFGAEACLNTILSGSACTSGTQVGTSNAAGVAGGAYLALYRRRPSLAPWQAESALLTSTPDTFFTINTIPSPFFGQTFAVKILTSASIQAALGSI